MTRREPRARLSFHRLLVPLAMLVVACPDSGLAPGAACHAALDCASGLCFARSATDHVCAQRCAADGDCPAGEVCGIFDVPLVFHTLDMDADIATQDPTGRVQLCRVALNSSCAGGCGPTALCVGDPGVCAPRCATCTDCGGHACLPAGADGNACAPPCNSIRECPRFYYCDLVHTDVHGHGECLPITSPFGDAGASPDASCGVTF